MSNHSITDSTSAVIDVQDYYWQDMTILAAGYRRMITIIMMAITASKCMHVIIDNSPIRICIAQKCCKCGV
eukprot:scaffold381755_cov22-Prasinocladus_malaysianus.AAC.1